MRLSPLQIILIVSLAIAVAYNAEAQVRPNPPAYGPVKPDPRPPVIEDALSRESTQVIDLSSRGVRAGRQVMDVTSQVRGAMRNPVLSSLIVIASSDVGNGTIDLQINGRSVLGGNEILPMKRKALQTDLDYLTNEIRTVQLVTNGQVLIHSLIVNSSRSQLPGLDGRGGIGIIDDRLPVINDVCDVKTAGVVNGRYYNYQILLKGRAIDGGDSLDEIINKLAQLEEARVCRRPSEGQCSLSTAGTVNGRYHRMTIIRDKVAFAGAETLDDVLVLSNQLQGQRICSMAVHRCELTTAGTTSGGLYYQHRLLVNGQALFGANDLASLLDQLNVLRRHHLCN